MNQYEYPKILLFSAVCLVLFTPSLIGQKQSLLIRSEWARFLGGHQNDEVRDAVQSIRGWIALAGTTRLPNRGEQVLFRLMTPDGQVRIRRDLGHKGDEGAQAVIQTFDGGFLLAGYTDSEWIDYRDGQPRNLGRKDAWLLKLDENGYYLWDLLLGGDRDDRFNALLQLPDGSILAAGIRDKKAFLVRVSATGELMGEKVWEDQFSELRQLALDDYGEYAFLAYDEKGRSSFFKLDDKEEMIAGPILLESDSLQEVSSFYYDPEHLRYVISGTTRTKKGRQQMALLVLDMNGGVRKLHAYGRQGEEKATALYRTARGEYLLAGTTNSHLRGARRSQGMLSFVNTRSFTPIDPKTTFFGGRHTDYPQHVYQLNDGAILVAGASNSNTGLNLDRDAWTVKFKDRTYELPPPSHPLLLSHDYEWVTPDPGDTLHSDTRAYLRLHLENDGATAAEGLRLLVSTRKAVGGIRYFTEMHMDRILPCERKYFAAPFIGTDELQSGENEVEVYLTGPGGDTLHTYRFDFPSKAEPRPVLEIVRGAFLNGTQTPKRGQPIELQLTIKNTGERPANNVVTRFYTPPRIRAVGERIFQSPALNPGDSTTVTFRFEIGGFYASDSLAIKCVAWGDQESTTAFGAFGLRLRHFYEVEMPDGRILLPEWLEESGKGGGPRAGYSDEAYATVDWNNPDLLDGSRTIYLTDSDVINFNIRIGSNVALDTASFQFLVDDEPYLLQNLHLVPVSLGSGEFQYAYQGYLHLPIGEHRIRFLVIKDGKVIGRPIPGEIRLQYQPAKRILHLISIGIPEENLQFTTKDAEAFAKVFKKQEGIKYAEVQPYLFNKPDSTTYGVLMNGLRMIFSDYRRIDPPRTSNDQLLEMHDIMLFISAHGFLDERRGMLRIPASDFDEYMPNFSSLPFEEDILWEWNRLPGDKYLFLDTCKSGNAGEETKENDDFQPPAPTSRADWERVEGFLFLSNEPDQFSYEDPESGYGAFTRALLEAFDNVEVKGRYGAIRADEESDGIITVQELVYFLRDRVPVITGKDENEPRQTPYMPERQFQLGSEADIYRLPK